MTTNISPSITPYQMRFLELISQVGSDEEMNDIYNLVSQYFSNKALDAIDKLWDEGTINDEIYEGWLHEHMRTPYRKCGRPKSAFRIFHFIKDPNH